jgi:AcrR family transcriptional regulator
MSDQRPYATLLAKGEDRRRLILAAAQRLLTRNGARGTTLGQIAQAAGVSPAGLLHHFESKEQLLNAVLDVRDADDDEHGDRQGDIIEELERVIERFSRSPDLIGTFSVLRMENIDPEAPLHDRFLYRYRAAVDTLVQGIRREQRTGRYRPDVDPVLKATEIVAFLNGIETSWLLDPSVPLADVFREYASSLKQQLLARPPATR